MAYIVERIKGNIVTPVGFCRSITSGIWTSFKNLAAKFSKTIPSEAAKNANTWLMKCFSDEDRLSQC